MKFWQEKKVLVTGHTGFKGSWLSLWLQKLNAHVVGLALEPETEHALFNLAHVADGMNSVIADIRNFESVLAVFKEHKPEIVIHMAAQPLVRASYNHPIETYATNVLGTVHILEAVRQVGSVKAIVNITTDKCYENQEWYWGYREEDKLGGYDPYSNSKACSELVTSAYRNSYFNSIGIGLASARAGNVFGGGDWACDRLIPDIMRACIKQETVSIRNPTAIRPWQHVLEALNAYLLLVEKLYHSPEQYASSWNFGPEEQDVKSVEWIVACIIKNWHQPIDWCFDKRSKLHEASYLKLDCSKAKTELGWYPRWSLEKGLNETISWYQAFQQGNPMREKTLAQIALFEEEF